MVVHQSGGGVRGDQGLQGLGRYLSQSDEQLNDLFPAGAGGSRPDGLRVRKNAGRGGDGDGEGRQSGMCDQLRLAMTNQIAGCFTPY